MASIPVPEAFAVLTAAGGADGYATVASNTGYYPGCDAWLYDTVSGLSKHCMITDLVGSTKVGLRIIPDSGSGAGPSYGRSSLTAFPITTSSLSMPAQTARVDASFTKRPKSEV